MNNIKGIKLYGWEHKLIKKIYGIYEEANGLWRVQYSLDCLS